MYLRKEVANIKQYESTGLGKVILVELSRGENIVGSILEACKNADIKNAYIASSVGSVQHLKYHRPMTLAPITEDEILTYDEPLELGSISGTIINGQPHLHISAASPEGVRIGHLEPDTEVLYLVEVTIVEIRGLELKRMVTKAMVMKLFPLDAPEE